MTLGEYIAKYRVDHSNMSLRSFAKLADLSATYVSNLEKGINNDGNTLFPTISTYRRIADATGITLTELLSLVDDSVTINAPISDQERELLMNFRDSSPEIQRAAFTMLEDSAAAQRKKQESTASQAG